MLTGEIELHAKTIMVRDRAYQEICGGAMVTAPSKFDGYNNGLRVMGGGCQHYLWRKGGLLTWTTMR